MISNVVRALLVCLLIAGSGCNCGGHQLVNVTPDLDGGIDAGHHDDGGMASCGDTLDMQGCPCAAGTAPRQCYSGPSDQAGIGTCVYGQQTCSSGGELSSGTWGPCLGAGQPKTCAGSGANCGTLSDGCGGVLSCGDCPGDTTCGGQAPNQCSSTPCNPKTCGDLNLDCGSASDGCQNLLDCGTCPSGETCGGDGTPGVCGCTPKTCASLGLSCGPASDSCGGTLNCGSCPSGQTCGGGGVAGACGCGHNTCASLGLNCGPALDGCGGALDCGSCPSGQTCGGSGVPGVCSCTPKTCSQLGLHCGPASDGCGGTLDCGSCPSGQTCGGGGSPGVCGTGYSWTGPGCGPLQYCSFATATDELDGGAHPFVFETTAAACQAYCNSFPDTVCCTWSPPNSGIPNYCAAITDPVCATPITGPSDPDGWSYDPTCSEAGSTFFYGSLCNH